MIADNKAVNVMLKRSDRWKDIIDKEVISLENMWEIDGSTATIPITAEILRQFYNFDDEQINDTKIVSHSTTHNAYVNLITKNCRANHSIPTGLIFVTPPSDEEQNYAKEKGVELDITPIAKDGFVFITHKDNPVDNITTQQIQDIYSGKITNWKELGGKDTPIKAYQREKNSGSQTAMEQLVMKGKPMLDPINIKEHVGMGVLVDAVAEYENGPASIGYTYYYYINNLYKNDNIKILKVDGYAPSNDNLISVKYPFTTNYFAVIRSSEPENSPSRKLRDFLLTKTGQDIISMAGYCKAVNE